MLDDSNTGGKISRGDGDEGDQGLHSDKDTDMSALLISECLAEEDFRVALVPELEDVACEDDLEDPAVHRHALGSGTIYLASSIDRCDGTVICAVAGGLDERDDGIIPAMAPEELIQYKFGPEALPERVVPVAILPTFVDWEEKYIVDDLTGAVLPPELVKAAKHEKPSVMYRWSVWTETPVSKCTSATGKLPIPVCWVITNKGDKSNYNVRARLVATHLVSKYGCKGLRELFAAMLPVDGETVAREGSVQSESCI